MDIAMGAMNTLLPKLVELMVGEYKLNKGVKGEIKELEDELVSMTAALRKVAEVPPDELDEQVKIWASDVRELSYDIEDEVDTFMLRVKKHDHTKPFSLKGFIGKATDLYKKVKTNHKMHNVVKDIMGQVKKVSERYNRYKVDNIAARLGGTCKSGNIAGRPDMVVVDPRLEGMYRKAAELVGIGRPKKELANRLLERNPSSPWRQQPNIISIVGFGGLGKTTLANSLLQDLKAKFECHIFVSVSLTPDIKKIFKNILLQLDDKKYSHLDEGWEVNQLIDKIKEFLKDRRCLCVIDDLWKESAWDAIKLAFQDGDPGSKIIITTRNRNVAEHVCGGVYDLKPLSDNDSRELLSMRIFDRKDGCPPNFVEVAGKIIKKCGGVPLAIITTASLLASKPMCLDEWEKVNKSIGSGLGNSLHVDNMRKILSLSYNDLPFHLKTCLLSLSKYPEDQVIEKDVLVWSWIAEGFIKQEKVTQGRPSGKSLQEIAESYFNDLINRSLIQPIERHFKFQQDDQVRSCQVHDMVLELITRLSAEEGFVAVLLSEDDQLASTLTSTIQNRKIRRLSLHNNSIEYYAASPNKESREQPSKLRSLDIFGKVTSSMPLSSFPILRVLRLDDCSGLDSHHLNDLGKLRLLRFLRLHELKIDELPKSIGELESLETLDIRRQSKVSMVLPVSLAKLGKLVRLIATKMELSDGLRLKNMKSLRELVGICVTTMDAAMEITVLIQQLKVLQLRCTDPITSSHNWVIVMCLEFCPCLQELDIRVSTLLQCSQWYRVDLMAHLPSGLRKLNCGGYFMLEFPKWTKPQLSYLTALRLLLWSVRVLPEHLEQLAELPSLRFLNIGTLGQPDEPQQELTIASGFPCLTDLNFSGHLLFLKFQPGAMRRLQKLFLRFCPNKTKEHFCKNNVDCGFENLPSLRRVAVQFLQRDCAETGNAIRKAVNDHPNHPSLFFPK